MLGRGDLRLLLPALLEERPRHGYELIQLVAEMFLGNYLPSAGTVYPALAQLQQAGLVAAREQGSRRLYALTEHGRAFVADNAERIAQVRAHSAAVARTLAKASLPQEVRQGLDRVKRALGARRGRWQADGAARVAAILQQAAAAIDDAD
ncbi:MAG: PadR family transcriptional regulator [Pseudoxanthomonas sp.]